MLVDPLVDTAPLTDTSPAAIIFTNRLRLRPSAPEATASSLFVTAVSE
jgi:hypothetical protein